MYLEINKRTVKATLKKLDLEDFYNDNNNYPDNISEIICLYLINNSTNDKIIETANNTLTIINNNKIKLKEEQEEHSNYIPYQINNTTYTPNKSHLQIADIVISNNTLIKDYPFSDIAKDISIEYAIKLNTKYNKSVQKIADVILYLYTRVITNMNKDRVCFEKVKSRYTFSENKMVMPAIEKIIEVEQCAN